MILQALVQATGSGIVPAVYITTAAALSLIAALTLKNKAGPATTRSKPGTTTTAPMSS